MGRILLLGGTGAIGTYLVPALLHLGHQVDVTTRQKNGESRNGVNYLIGDARECEFLGRICEARRYDAIIDLMVHTTEAFGPVSRLLTSTTGHYIFVSSYRVFANRGLLPITEYSPRLIEVSTDTEYLSTNDYALEKARQEDILRRSNLKNWTIVRPGITYSKNRFQLGTLEANTLCFRALQGMPVIMAREILDRRTTMTWAGDVARFIGRLALNDRAKGTDFNVVTCENRTWREVLHYYQQAFTLRLIETDVETYIRVVGNRFQVIYDRAFDRVMDNRKVLEATAIDQSELVPLQVGLLRELSAFVKSPYYQYPDLALNARIDRQLGTRLNLGQLRFAEKIRYIHARYPWRTLLAKVTG